jgi:hypothetical protein
VSSEGQGIFLIRDDALTVLRKAPYESEALLQQALASFPAVLAGGTTASDDEDPRTLLLVRREMGVPKAEGAGATWSVDHLFVADDAVPVVVEVKRSSDTRIRREVVGQMLDYAANAVRYWPIGELRAAFDETAAASGTTGEARLREAIPDVDVEEFWGRVAANLAAGHVRMVFVADELPDELIRVIEFLNEQMSPAEVLGVEVPQFVGADGHQVLVPRLIGRTSAAVATKQSAAGTQWSEATLLEAAADRHGDALAGLLERLFDHVREVGVRFSWGRGVSPGVSGWYDVDGTPIAVWTANVGAATPGARPYAYLYLPELKRRLSPEHFGRVVNLLDEVVPYRAKLEEARANEFANKYPAVFLSDLVASPEDERRFLAALTTITQP